jgi:hypothetical protein
VKRRIGERKKDEEKNKLNDKFFFKWMSKLKIYIYGKELNKRIGFSSTLFSGIYFMDFEIV